MSTGPDPRRRLAELMEERRLDLGLYWQDVVDAAIAAGFKLSLKTLHSVRAGTAGIRPLTQRAIEAGLQWEHGSIQSIEDGGDPAPAPVPYPRPVAAPEPLLVVADDAEAVSSAGIIALLPPHERRVWSEIHRHPAGTPADVIFPDPVEAALFSREAPELDRIRWIAALRSVHVAYPPRRREARAG